MKISNPADGTVITEVTADNATAVRRKYELARAGQAKWAKLPLKKRLAAIANFRERVVTMRETLARTLTHEVGKPKEDPAFWPALRAMVPYDPARTLLIDDSLPVLRAARQAGIAHLLAVYRPDSRQPEKDVGEFAALRHFADILPE